jgi:anthranilate synthase component 1
MTYPSFGDFQRLAKSYNIVPVFREVILDRVTPVSVYERLARGEPYAFLLESVEGGEHLGRYSFVGQRPRAIFSYRDHRVVYREGRREKSWQTTNPVQELKALFSGFRGAPVAALPRFWGGAVGYWDYDTVRFFERLPEAKPDLLGLSQGAFQLTGDVVMFDRFAHTAKIIANVFIPGDAKGVKALVRLYRAAVEGIDRQIARIHDSRFPPEEPHRGTLQNPRPLAPRAHYLRAVRKAKDYIRAGDIIQVVLSTRWMLVPNTTPFQVYRALRIVNPSPYMYCLHFPEMDMVGSSPELLVRKEGTLVETRPIAGTRRRGRDENEDRRLAEELKSDPKERAEHLMLVDLGRNDLGRVCRPGTVRVSDFMSVEQFSHVMHMVSSVTGSLSPEANAFDLLQACFPAGTVAGAPKIRAMEIIDELETIRRGPYAGAVGYFSYTGNMDMAITIRTLIFKKGTAYLQAGAGIVADSVPEREYRECQQKAAALVAAVRMAKELQ